MKSEKSFWERIGLHEWFLKDDIPEKDELSSSLTPDEIYHYIIEKFEEGIRQLSFADRVVFYHEYIICFNETDFQEFLKTRKGLFGLIVQECVKEFYDILNTMREQKKNVVPSANKWVFRFVSHPDYASGDKGFIGKLLPDSALQQDDNLRVTYIPRQTGIAQSFDINEAVLSAFHYYSEGYYELPYNDEQEGRRSSLEQAVKTTETTGKARLETILPDQAGKKLKFYIDTGEVTVSGIEAAADEPSVFRIPSDWVNTPHLRIRYNAKADGFEVASFGEKTIVNELEVPRSEENNPSWTELPINSQIVLNGIVGINIFKS
jgi:hypothetical protein